MKIEVMPLKAWLMKYHPRQWATTPASHEYRITEDGDVYAHSKGTSKTPGEERHIANLGKLEWVLVPELRFRDNTLLTGLYVGDREHVRKLQQLILDMESNLTVTVTEINRILSE